jgi:hypothetical protein
MIANSISAVFLEVESGRSALNREHPVAKEYLAKTEDLIENLITF